MKITHKSKETQVQFKTLNIGDTFLSLSGKLYMKIDTPYTIMGALNAVALINGEAIHFEPNTNALPVTCTVNIE